MAARITQKTKASVIAALLAGETVSSVSNGQSVPKATVSRIKSELSAEQLRQIGTEKRQSLSELIEMAFAAHTRAEMQIALDFEDAHYRQSLSTDDRLTIGRYCIERTKSLIDTGQKLFAPVIADDPAETLPELPAADFASDVDVPAEAPATDSELA